MKTTAFQTTYFEVGPTGELWPLDPATIRSLPDGCYEQVVEGHVTATYLAGEIVRARLVPMADPRKPRALVVTAQQCWQALRELVPELPETTPRAVLRVDMHHAILEWVEPAAREDGTVCVMATHHWPTKIEADALWHHLQARVGAALFPWRELRIEVRDVESGHWAVELEGRQLWLRETAGSEEKK
jgi:hypothetical protein